MSQCPRFRQLTTAPAQIRFRVRPITASPAPSHHTRPDRVYPERSPVTLPGNTPSEPSLTGGREVPERILVQRSPQRCQLYLFYPDPPDREVIIRKNAEQNPEIMEVYRRE